ncbi:hypothetical protein BTA51_11700 [Hahella sp. CCB-MM4]|uniref:RSP_7527 family protein n=1 Tax=Hahella sp. (strain CCB-MM4) TaxID=1926491 RepID=UPI000B9B61F6|nr:hypothetical protein [Hahella sp. CCB-MM4]OZG73150.1 hypothetical protein BTA51_11700 [Hahella sp. CCB-MM4]
MDTQACDSVVLDKAGRVDVNYYVARAHQMRAEAFAQFLSSAKHRISHMVHHMFEVSFHRTHSA